MADSPSTVQELISIVRKYGFEYFGVYYGKYRGIIVNVDDPQKLGRVQLRIPQIAGDNKMEYWAWPSGQPAGDDFGDFMVPPVNSPVWVTFENGDPSHPVYEGGFWGKKKAGVPSGSSGNPRKRIKASEKWRLEFDDENDKIFIEHKANGHKFEISGSGNIELSGSGNFSQTTGGTSTQTVAGPKAVNCAALSVSAAGASSFSLGGLNISFGGGELNIAGLLRVHAGGVEIMGKDFLTHHHNGVQAGGANTGGVV